MFHIVTKIPEQQTTFSVGPAGISSCHRVKGSIREEVIEEPFPLQGFSQGNLVLTQRPASKVYPGPAFRPLNLTSLFHRDAGRGDARVTECSYNKKGSFNELLIDQSEVQERILAAKVTFAKHSEYQGVTALMQKRASERRSTVPFSIAGSTNKKTSAHSQSQMRGKYYLMVYGGPSKG